MCITGNETTMIETLNALNDARLAEQQWELESLGSQPLLVTHLEGREIFQRRIATLEAKCRELGIHGPAPKADPGDTRRILAQR